MDHPSHTLIGDPTAHKDGEVSNPTPISLIGLSGNACAVAWKSNAPATTPADNAKNFRTVIAMDSFIYVSREFDR
jgi:hypothetical protein